MDMQRECVHTCGVSLGLSVIRRYAESKREDVAWTTLASHLAILIIVEELVGVYEGCLRHRSAPLLSRAWSTTRPMYCTQLRRWLIPQPPFSGLTDTDMTGLPCFSVHMQLLLLHVPSRPFPPILSSKCRVTVLRLVTRAGLSIPSGHILYREPGTAALLKTDRCPGLPAA